MRIHRQVLSATLFFCLIELTFAQQPLTLHQAIEIGLRNNYQIEIARNEAAISENNASLGNAGFLPTIDATGGANKSTVDIRQELANGTVTERDGAETTAKNAAINLDWTIFDGFNMFTSLKQFNTLRDIGDVSAKIAVEGTVADIISAYTNIIQQQQLLTAFGEAITISQERTSIAEGKYNIGAGSRLEWNRAKVDLIADSSAYLRQEVILSDAKIDLNRLLARHANETFAATDTIAIDTNLAFDNLQQMTAAENNLLQLAQQNIRFARLSLNAVRSEWLPEVRVNVGYDYALSESDAGFFLYNRNRRFNYGATLSWNLFNGFNTRRRAQNAKLDIENRELEYHDFQNLVEADLAKTFKRYEVSLTVVKLEEENVQLARQNVDIALQQFRLGAITSVDLREVQNNFVDSETRFIAAQLEAKFAETELLRLSGQLVR
jgi:outer membrane protein TolC